MLAGSSRTPASSTRRVQNSSTPRREVAGVGDAAASGGCQAKSSQLCEERLEGRQIRGDQGAVAVQDRLAGSRRYAASDLVGPELQIVV